MSHCTPRILVLSNGDRSRPQSCWETCRRGAHSAVSEEMPPAPSHPGGLSSSPDGTWLMRRKAGPQLPGQPESAAATGPQFPNRAHGQRWPPWAQRQGPSYGHLADAELEGREGEQLVPSQAAPGREEPGRVASASSLGFARFPQGGRRLRAPPGRHTAHGPSLPLQHPIRTPECEPVRAGVRSCKRELTSNPPLLVSCRK